QYVQYLSSGYDEYYPLFHNQWLNEDPISLPLFESILAFENYPVYSSSRRQVASLEICDVRYLDQTHYPLTVVVVPGAELSLRISYDDHRFEAATITRMLGHFQTLLAGIAANPEQRLAELPLLTEAERQQLLVEWNYTHTP